MTIVALSGPFILISSAFSNIVRAEGKPKVALMGMMIGNLVNIALDPVFILGFDLGITGAAIATVIGNLSAAVFYIIYFLQGRSKLSIGIKDASFEPKMVQKVLSIGIPASLSGLLMSVSTILVNGLMAGYGDLAVAGIGVSMKVTMITSFVCMGFGQGIQPILGFAYGAKNEKQFRGIMRFSLLFGLGLGVVMTGLCYLGLEPIVSGFLSDPASYDYAVSFTSVLLVSAPILGVLFVLLNALQAIGAATASLILNVSRQGLIFIPAVWLLHMWFALEGIVYAQPVADILAFVLASILYYRTSKKLFLGGDLHNTSTDEAEGSTSNESKEVPQTL